MSSHPTIAIVAALLCSAPALAQRTWVVDALGGPGSQFTDIPPAVAAAAPGDTILVLDGVYSPFATSKGIRVLGSQDTVLNPFSFVPLVVQNLPAGETFVMENLDAFLVGVGVELRNNAGGVHVERCVGPNRLLVDSCAHVTFANLDCSNVDVIDSLVTMTGVQVAGPGSFAVSVPAVSAVRSVLLLSGSELVGPHRNSPGPFGSLPGPGLRLDASRVAVSAGCRIVAGADAFRMSQVSGIVATNSTIEIDPGAVVTGTNGALPIASDRPVTPRTIPGLSATGGPPGGALVVTMAAPPRVPALVALSAPTVPVRIPGLGDIGLDPGSLAIAFSGAVPGAGSVTVNLAIPPLPAIVGTPITAQGLTASGAGLSTSVPATVVLR